MGKYMRKSKLAGEVAAMELFRQSTLGVRTRAKTLALQRLQSLDSTCYLQLRSRRLEKPLSLSSPQAASASAATTAPGAKASETCTGRDSSSSSPNLGNHDHDEVGAGNTGSAGSVPVMDSEMGNENDDGVEVSFGENVLELETIDRNSRETTPCNLIFSETIATPGSTTRSTNMKVASRIARDAECPNIPAAHEMEEFFAEVEQLQQRTFIEKYNYDPVNDCPLPGRYEWMTFNSSC